MDELIPRVIHYCWFGRKPYPKIIQQSINSWSSYLPGFEFHLWTEDNFDYSSCIFSSQAYSMGKFAFVADYARIKILYQYGGIYLDTDMEWIKNIDAGILCNKAFASGENSSVISAGIIGSIPGHPWIREILNYYENSSFIQQDGKMDLTSIPNIITQISSKFGFTNCRTIQNFFEDVQIYPPEYFYPKSYITNELVITDNSYTIHHFAESWLSFRTRLFMRVDRFFYQLGFKNSVVDSIKSPIKKIIKYQNQ
jgi:mannosyltransferase OCH1-like enzyme